MSNVFNENGVFTDSYKEMLDTIQPEQEAIEAKITAWLKMNNCTCLDYRLAYEVAIDQMKLHAVSQWMTCVEQVLLESDTA